LASGVSGGSVGLMPFLLEYATDGSRAFHDLPIPQTPEAASPMSLKNGYFGLSI